jgi:N-acetylglucosaminyl-diphospho-decaprenol L-rhamnosyltransferase
MPGLPLAESASQCLRLANRDSGEVATQIDTIIVTYGSGATVSAALSSVLQCGRVTRTIVVDNASGDGTPDASRAAGASLVIENDRNVGFAAAVNRGLQESTAGYVLLLNPDASIDATSLELLAAALDADPQAVMAGPLLIAPDGRIELGARRFSTVLNRLVWYLPLPWRPQWSTPQYRHTADLLRRSAPQPVDYLWGAALLIRRGFLDDIGGLDERFFLYSEDEDLGRQARARGCRTLLVPRARAHHVGGTSTPDPALAQARVIAANAQLLEKWEGARAARWFRRCIGPALSFRAALLRIAGRRAEADLAALIRSYLGST